VVCSERQLPLEGLTLTTWAGELPAKTFSAKNKKKRSKPPLFNQSVLAVLFLDIKPFKFYAVALSG
jgi:hypothetical protein